MHRGLRVEDYILHHVPSPLLTDATFIYGKRDEEGCLIHVVWSAQWNESWREQYCHNVPLLTTPRAILERSGLQGFDECNFLFNGRRVEDGSTLSLLPGAQLEIELASNASSAEYSSSEHGEASAQDVDEAALWQVGTSSAQQCHLNKATIKQQQIREMRPNHAITPDPDAFVPFRQRDATGQLIIGRTIAPPNWERNRMYRYAAESGSLYRDDADELRIRIRSWIASVRTQLILPHRDFTIRGQLMGEIETKIRRAWPDQILPTDRLKLTTVRPSPNVGYTGRKPLHILIELNRPRNSQLHPILIAHREITVQGPSPQVFWIPVLLATLCGVTTLHNVVAPPCRSDQMLIPLPGRVRRWLSHNDARPIFAGLFLPIWWDARLQPPPVPAYEDDDQPALMQMTAPPLNAWTGKHGDDTFPPHEDDETISFMQQGTPTLSDQPSESSFLVVHPPNTSSFRSSWTRTGR